VRARVSWSGEFKFWPSAGCAHAYLDWICTSLPTDGHWLRVMRPKFAVFQKRDMEFKPWQDDYSNLFAVLM